MLKALRNRITGGDRRSAAVKKNMIALIVLRVVSMIVSFLLVPATIGYVSAEIYGVWLIIFTIQTWLQFFDIGLTQGLKNKLTEALALNDVVKARSLVSTTYISMAMIFIPLIIIVYYAVPHVNWPALLNVSTDFSADITEAIRVVTVLVCLQMIINVITSVAAAYQQIALNNLFIVIANLISYFAILALRESVAPSLTVLAYTISGLPLLVNIIASIILFSTRYKAVRPSFRLFNPSLTGSLFTLGVKFFIINVQVLVVYQSTNILISNVSSPEAVTEYNLAYKYLSLAMIFYTNLTMPLWPAFTDAFTNGDYKWMRDMRRKMSKILGICIMGCLLLGILSPWIYKIWIGDKVSIPLSMTWIVAVYVIIYCYMNLNGTLVLGMGKVHLESIVVMIGMILYIPLALGLGHLFSQYGVILALISINLIYAIFFQIQTDKLLSRKATGIWLK